VRFDRPVATTERIGRRIKKKLFVISPGLEGSFRYVNAQTLEFRPDESFDDATRYRVRIRPEAVGDQGVLVGNVEFRFHTPLFGLESLDVRYRRGRAEAQLTFSHAVRPEAVDDAVLFETASGASLRVRRTDRELARQVTYRLPFGPANWPEEEVRLRIDASLRASRGTDALGKTVIRVVEPPAERPPLSLQTVRGRNLGARTAVEWIFSEPVDPAVVRAAAQLSPEPQDAQWVQTRRGVAVLGRFTGRTVDAGLGLVRGREGGLMTSAPVRTVSLPPPVPGVEVWDSLPRLRLLERGPVRLRLRQIVELDLQVDAVPRAYVNAALQGFEGVARTLDRRRESVAGRDEVELPLQFELPPDLGLLRLTIRDADRPWVAARRDVIAYGLDLMVKRRLQELWVQAYGPEGKPASGVQIEVRDAANEPLARGRTDATGAVRLEVADGGEPRLVMGSGPGRFALVDLDTDLRVEPRRPPREAWILAGSSTVTAGSSLPVWAGRKEGGLASGRVELVDGSEVLAEAALEDGRADLWVPTRAGGRTGRLRVKVGQRRLLAHGPDVDVEVPPGAGEPMRIRAEPSAERVRFAVEAPSATPPIRITGRCRYRPQEADLSAWSGPRIKRTLESGEAEFNCRVAENVVGTVGLTFRAVGVDAVGRRLTGTSSLQVQPYDVNLQIDVRSDATGAPRIRANPLDRDGNPKAGLRLTMTLLRQEMEPVLEWDEGGPIQRWRSQWVPVVQRTGSSQADGLRFPEPPTAPGRYRLLVEGDSAFAQTEFRVAGDEPGLVVARVGDSVRVSVPWDTPTWLTLEGQTLHDRRWLAQGGGSESLVAPPDAGRLDVVAVTIDRAEVRSVQGSERGPEVTVQSRGFEGDRTKLLLRSEASTALVVVPATEVPPGGLGAMGSAYATFGGGIARSDPSPPPSPRARRPSAEAGASPWLSALRTDRLGYAVLRVPAPAPRRLALLQPGRVAASPLPDVERPLAFLAPPPLDAYVGDRWRVGLMATGGGHWTAPGAEGDSEDGRVDLVWAAEEPGMQTAEVRLEGEGTATLSLEGRVRRPAVRALRIQPLQTGYGDVGTATVSGIGTVLLSPEPHHMDAARVLRLHRLGPLGKEGRRWSGAQDDPVLREAAATLDIPWRSAPDGGTPPRATDLQRRLADRRWLRMEPDVAFQELEALAEAVDGADPTTVGIFVGLRRRVADRMALAPYWGRVDRDGDTWVRFNSKRVLWASPPEPGGRLEVSTTGSGTVYGAWLGWEAVDPSDRLKVEVLDAEGEVRTQVARDQVSWLRVTARELDGHHLEVPLPGCMELLAASIPARATRARGWVEGSMLEPEGDRTLWARVDGDAAGFVVMVRPRVGGTCVVPAAAAWSAHLDRVVAASAVGRVQID
jgi:hypothetical protein